MIEFDSKKWEQYDPDGILARRRDTVSGLNFDLEKDHIFPREGINNVQSAIRNYA